MIILHEFSRVDKLMKYLDIIIKFFTDRGIYKEHRIIFGTYNYYLEVETN